MAFNDVRIHSAMPEASTCWTMLIKSMRYVPNQPTPAARESEPQTSTSYAIARPRKMITSHSPTAATALAFVPAENSNSWCCVNAAGATERLHKTVPTTPTTISAIFSQNDKLVNSRTGSAITSSTPVMTMTTSADQSQGANRRQTSPNVCSTRTSSSTRSETTRTETNTMPIIRIWIDWMSGTAHPADWIARLKGVAWSHSANSSIYAFTAEGLMESPAGQPGRP